MFVPQRNGRFRIEVHNLGRTWNHFTFVTR